MAIIILLIAVTKLVILHLNESDWELWHFFFRMKEPGYILVDSTGADV
jgi:hypothetical protein